MLKPWVACGAFVVFVVGAGAWITASAPAGHAHGQGAAATCSCGCKGTPRPACAHSCKGVPCTGATMSHSRIVAGEMVEKQPATFSVVAANGVRLEGFVVGLDRGNNITTNATGHGVFTPAARRNVPAAIEGVTATDIQVIGAKEAASAASRVPRFATVGGEVSITRPGLFDGQAENTKTTVGSATCHVLFEAPHQSIFSVPADAPTGTASLRIEDGGRKFEQPMRLVRLGISADDLRLERGVTTNGRVTIDGADDMLVGGVLRIENLSREIIQLEISGARGSDTLQQKIDKGMIKNGVITVPLTITGRQRGAFNVVATLFDPNALSPAKCSCGCGGTPRPACAHSCKGNPCTGAIIRP